MSTQKLAESRLPTVYGEFQMIAYSSEFEDFPHLALVHKNTDLSKPVPVRVHSECMTGDVFGSVRCDCGEQLHGALEHFSKHGGILIYLRQEGRGIGLVNKLKAYNLQDEGMDTIKANYALGFHADERDYAPAIDILNSLKIKEISLLTNNPEKLDAFVNTDIKVKERLPIEMNPQAENEGYLRTKKEDMGHLLKRVRLD